MNFLIPLLVLSIQITLKAECQTAVTNQQCTQVDKDPSKLICVCNENYCDKLETKWPQKSGEIYLYQTTRAGLRLDHVNLTPDSGVEANNNNNNNNKTADCLDKSANQLEIDLGVEHQPILGWGGAFTDAAAININSLSKGVDLKLLESYYGDNGLQYNFGRVPVGSTDFSARTYSYDDTRTPEEPDYNLTKWALADEDLSHKIPVIKRAMEIRSKNSEPINNSRLKLFGSPWTPPVWMKTSHNYTRGHLLDDDRVYQSYANYLIKFYQAYKEHGINFWGATVQNEPIAANLPFYFFNSLQMTNSESIRFISKFLGPALEANGYNKSNFKLMIGDDSLGFINSQVPDLIKDEGVRKYVSGLAFHWYTSGTLIPYESLSSLVDSIKDHIEFVMMSEACTGSRPMSKHVDLGSWDRGESYADDIISDLVHKTSAWIDWNLALDEGGGPNWSRNFVDSPIIVNAKRNEFYKQPMYYVLAHFSRFFKEGSVRVQTDMKENAWLKRLMAVAVHDKSTGHLIVNILNKSDRGKQISISVKNSPSSQTTSVKSFMVEEASMNTVIIKL